MITVIKRLHDNKKVKKDIRIVVISYISAFWLIYLAYIKNWLISTEWNLDSQ